LAVSRDSSNGPGWTDVRRAIAHYEDLLDVRITLLIHATGLNGRKDLTVTGVAVSKPGIEPEASISASASVGCLASNLVSLEAVILLLLHELDGDIYRQETGIQPQQK
jgi:hypothetical protein